MSLKKKKIVTKIRIEFDDGSAQELEGEDADKWDKAATSQGIMAWAHGVRFPELQWKQFPAPSGTTDSPQ